MSTAPELPPTGPDDVAPLLSRLVDDAALFPPGDAAMVDAVRGHLAAREGRNAGLVGFFLCPVSRLPDLIVELVKAKPAEPVQLSLVVNNGLGGVPKAVSTVEGRKNLLQLRMIEMPAPSDVDATWLERVSEFVPEDVIRVVEPRRPQPSSNGTPDQGGHEAWLDGVRRVARHGCWPKLRCGGPQAGAFPSIDVVADFIAAVCAEGVPFKATAGLHHAVRHRDESTGFTHHGFLNLLVAVSRALAGGRDVAGALTVTDGEALVAELGALPEPAVHAVRQVFASYGSCSLAEPVADLEALGLL
ncbi:MAG TPA: hypothetical protein VGD67_06120 [Pseudonocardiaceae bacterium]